MRPVVRAGRHLEVPLAGASELVVDGLEIRGPTLFGDKVNYENLS